MTATTIPERSERRTRRIERVRRRLARHISQLATHRRWNAPKTPQWQERESELLRQVALAQIELVRLESSRGFPPPS